MKLDVKCAEREIAGKSPARIDLDTAATWAARAVVYRRAAERADAAGGGAGNNTRNGSCELWAGYDDARHEALEHAGTGDESGRSVKAVAQAIDDACRPRRRR